MNTFFVGGISLSIAIVVPFSSRSKHEDPCFSEIKLLKVVLCTFFASTIGLRGARSPLFPLNDNCLNPTLK